MTASRDRSPSDGEVHGTSPATDEVEIVGVVGFDDAAVEGDAADEVEVVFDDVPGDAVRVRPDALEDGNRERFLRLAAEFDNYRKRVDRERSENERHATAGLVARLLPVLDNLERALEHRGADDGLYKGVGLVHRQLFDELRHEGLSVIEAAGRPFDPTVHEAVATAHVPGVAAGVVVDEFQRGYRLHDRLLRPALVRVNGGDGGVPDAEAGS